MGLLQFFIQAMKEFMLCFTGCRILRVLLCVVGVAAAAMSTGCAPFKSARPASEASHIRFVYTVTPGVLIRGAEPDEQGMRELRDNFSVKTLVNFNNLSTESEAKLAAQFGLNYLPLPDHPISEAGDEERYLAFMKAVREARAKGELPVYVHCDTGLDRVGLAVGVYRIVEDGWDAEQAVAELRGYQRYFLAVFFYRYDDILREVEQKREEWRSRLNNAPAPPVQRNAPGTEPTTQR